MEFELNTYHRNVWIEISESDEWSCFTVLDDLGIIYSTAGENIAAGNKTGSKTFLQWKEDNENYNGQGHRRNMLEILHHI